ncbi:hypothetical protein Pmani_024948 [Petrolisthes manimaculis]|uniref:Uncharacterized protein n=1 Tax=Petrolisthes manimaculis TaxID=1843537 RepID=A0AAE1P941_9EUCA|nr:hypothetical protein Pmani_024948 [Petrolisthes manimaculis]
MWCDENNVTSKNSQPASLTQHAPTDRDTTGTPFQVLQCLLPLSHGPISKEDNAYRVPLSLARSAQCDPSHYSYPSSLAATSTPCSMLTKSTIKGASALALPCPPRRWLVHVVGNSPRSHQHRHKDQGARKAHNHLLVEGVYRL